MRMDDYAVEEAVAGTRRLLIHLGMIKGDPDPKDTLIIKESSWTRAKVSGIFASSVQLGDSVKKGQMMAKITDPYGQVKVPVKSPSNGYVVGLNNNPVVNAGDALVHIGRD